VVTSLPGLGALAGPRGHDVDGVFEQVADGHADDLTAHQQGFVHFQAGLTEFSRLRSPVGAATRTPLPTPGELVGAVMGHVQRLVKTLVHPRTDRRRVHPDRHAHVARIARDITRKVPGVRVASAAAAAVAYRPRGGERHVRTRAT
jgi:hypothetical protein